MVFTVTLHSSISEIGQTQWDSAVGQHHAMLRHRWLTHLENGSLKGFAPRYIVARDSAGQVVAHAAAYVNSTSVVIFSSGFLRFAVDFVRRFIPSFLMVRILECGMPVGLGEPVCVLDGVEPEYACEAILAGLEELSASEGTRMIVIRDLADDAETLKRLAARSGYTMVPHLPNAVLRVRWASFDEFLSEMRSRYRLRLRKRLKGAAEAGLRCEISAFRARDAAWIRTQIRNVDAAATEFQRDVLHAGFFERLRETGTEWLCFTVLQQEHRAAVAVVLVDGAIARWTFFGRDTAGTQDGAYFLALSEIVRFSINRRLQSVELGLTTYRPKLEFGAEVARFEIAVRIRLLGGELIVNLLKRLNKVAEVASKDIFKSSTSAGVDKS